MAQLLRTICAIFLVAYSVVPARAHEFWIDPHAYQVAPGETMVADLRVGQYFEGTASSYLPVSFRRFEIATEGGIASVEGRMGDRPALSITAPEEGLAVVIHVTTDSVLTYREFELFESFVRHKDAAWTLDEHAARGLPETGFREGYSRYAKSLIAVGSGAGEDRAFGLETEIVAGANPYVDDVSAGFPVALYYQGSPRPEAQIEIFDKAPSGEVSVSTIRTDAQGLATVQVTPGHEYMLDAVVLREPEGELAGRDGVVWESLWANLTFAVPE